MQMSILVPHDGQLLRRTIRFLIRPQVRLMRVLGAVLTVLGVLLLMLDAPASVGYTVVVCGPVLAVGFGPLTTSWALRTQPAALSDTYHLTLDDEWVQVSFPLVETRCRWAGLGRIVETPEVWYVMFGKVQAVPIPKAAMTPEQRAEFAAYVAQQQPAPA